MRSHPHFTLKLKFRDLPGFELCLNEFALFKHVDGTYELQARVDETIQEIREEVENKAVAYHREKMLAVLQARARSLGETQSLNEWFATPFAV